MEAKRNRKIRKVKIIGLSLLIMSMSLNFLLSQEKNETYIEISRDELIPKLEYDSKSEIFYYIDSDQDNIYVYLRFMDETLQKKVLLYGMQIYLDPRNKKKKNLSIKYPIGSINEQDNSGSLRLNYAELRALAVQPVQEIELTGFIGKDEKSYLYTHDQEGIHGSIDFDQMGSMFYIMVIPLTEVPGMQENQVTEFSVGIETGHLELTMSPSAMEDIGGKSAGGGRGGGGGRSGGGGRGGSRGSGQSLSQPRDIEGMTQADKIWIKDLTMQMNIQE